MIPKIPAGHMRRMRSSKKAVFEVQFNWIFILIAGGVFLFLFLSIVSSQKKAADQSVNAELLSKVDSLIAGSASSFQSSKTVSLPSVQLDVICDADHESALQVSGSLSKRTPIQAIYARPHVDTKHLMIFTDAYEAGFGIAPILYLSGANTNYLLINDTTANEKFVAKIFSLFPENVTKVVHASPDASYPKQADETVFVKIGPGACPTPFSGALCVLVTPSSPGDDTAGTVQFCASSSSCSPSQGYAGLPMLKGAIVSADNTSYACTSGKLLERQSILATLALNRTQQYISSGKLSLDCNTTYTSIKLPLRNLVLARDLSNSQTIYSSSKSLSVLNEDLIRGTRCPLLY